jgi:glucose/arabinose dehydrogenase
MSKRGFVRLVLCRTEPNRRRPVDTFRSLRLLTIFALASLPCIATATVPTGFTEFPVVTGLSNPTAMAFAPDGRLFVCQQGGALRVIKGGALLAAPFVSLSVDSAGERGLLGVAFDPEFATNQWVYVYYTATTPNVHSRVSRFTANGDIAIPGSEVVILDVSTTAGTNHQGGGLKFSADGRLLVVIGDNGNSSNAQSLGNLHGKMLRLERDGTIPANNPFVNSATGINRAIWAYGLRNPFTFDVQPGTGRVFINDVGASSWEEVNDGVAGGNYGWPTTEGFFSATQFPQFRNPIHAYSISGTECAVVGGAFYNPSTANFPAAYLGRYFFGDLCGNWIDMIDPSNGNAVTRFATSIVSQLVDLEIGPDGSLYYLSRSGGTVRRIAYTAPSECTPSTPAASFTNQYRLYHDGTKEHLYTTDFNEYQVLGTRSWAQEGVAYRIFGGFGSYNGACTIAFYRLYHSPSLQHHWTTDANEVAVLTTRPGWTYEGIIGYILSVQAAGSVPLYRLVYPNPVVHVWTTDAFERQVLITQRGWVDEGVAGYVVP